MIVQARQARDRFTATASRRPFHGDLLQSIKTFGCTTSVAFQLRSGPLVHRVTQRRV